MTLGGRGEFQIIDYLRRQRRPGRGLVMGIGDDCSVARIAAGEDLLTTADLLTESVHFNLEWTDLLHLGRKAVAVNVSDLAAMGARPRYLYLSMAIPDRLGADELDRFFTGFLDACDAYGVILAGGDTCRSPSGLTISVSAQGTAPEGRWIGRGGAAAGDDLYVSGTLGDSALALRMLLAGSTPEPFLLQRHIDPTARVATGLALSAAALPSAMIDISDGMLGDLEHILAASRAGAAVELAAIPLSESFRRHVAAEPALMELALAGGEDYELLFTAPEGRREAVAAVAEQTAVPIACIGKIVSGDLGLKVFGPAGEVDLPRRRGYKHFHEST